MFAIIDQIKDSETTSLAAIWDRLATFLEVHAKTEEDFFYPALLKIGQGEGGKSSAQAETIDAIKDHNDIRDAVSEVRSHKVGSAAWRKAVAKANAANGEHMDEEERQGLVDFRRQAPLKTRHDLAVRFAKFEALHINGVHAANQSPRAYVDKNG